MNASAKRTTNIYTEAVAGITTFFTMVYIVIVNPQILATEGTGMAFSGVLTATVLVCFTMTLLMGLYAKLPFAESPAWASKHSCFTIILAKSTRDRAGNIYGPGLVSLVSVTRYARRRARHSGDCASRPPPALASS